MGCIIQHIQLLRFDLQKRILLVIICHYQLQMCFIIFGIQLAYLDSICMNANCSLYRTFEKYNEGIKANV